METPKRCLKRLDNKIDFIMLTLDADENDKELGKFKYAQKPSAAQVRNVPAEVAARQALAFSSHTNNPNDLYEHGFMLNDKLKTRDDTCGLVIDKRDVDEMLKGDVYLDWDRESGNVRTAFVMLRGWNEAHRFGVICHECGNFPAYTNCTICGCGAFCDPLCYNRARRGVTHNDDICHKMAHKRVGDSMMAQLERTMEDLNVIEKERELAKKVQAEEEKQMHNGGDGDVHGEEQHERQDDTTHTAPHDANDEVTAIGVSEDEAQTASSTMD